MVTKNKINRRYFIKKLSKLFGAVVLIGLGKKFSFPGIINTDLPTGNQKSIYKISLFDYYELKASDESCTACKKHNSNKKFRTLNAAVENRCHKNCHCEAIKKQCSETEYKIWFEHENIADLRWPRVKNKMIS